MQNREYLPYNSQGAVEYYAQVYAGFWKDIPRYLIDDYVEAVR